MIKLINPILLATIGKAHGLKGEVRLNSLTLTEDPLYLKNFRIVLTDAQHTMRIR